MSWEEDGGEDDFFDDDSVDVGSTVEDDWVDCDFPSFSLFLDFDLFFLPCLDGVSDFFSDLLVEVVLFVEEEAPPPRGIPANDGD